jgi:ubiquinone/menaquinone biosynthesis C-methylase UbiE
MAAAALDTRAGYESLLAAVRARSASCGAERVRRALLERLAVGPRDRVLELGFGSGRLLCAVAARAARGFVAGVEPEEFALRHAQRRCERLVREGRVKLLRGTSLDLSAFGPESFDKVYGVHVTYFWDDPLPHLFEIRRVLRPGGRLLLGYCPGEPGDADPARFRGELLASALRAAGFRTAHTERAEALAWTTAH